MAKIYALRAMIYAKYDNEAVLAKELGWPRQKLNKLTNGNKEPDIYEVKALAEKLERPLEEIVDLFLSVKSPNEQQEG